LTEPILNRLGLSLIAIISIASSVVGLTLFGHYYLQHHDPVVGGVLSLPALLLTP
jgi:hypothetical protein